MTGAPWQALRAHAARTLTGTALWTRPSDTPSTLGGQGTDATVSAALPCRLARLSGREAGDAARTNSAAQWVITVPYGTDIREQDALTVASKRYEVVGFASGDTSTLVRVWCQ